MNKLDLSFYYKTGEILHPLTDLEDSLTRGQVSLDMHTAFRHLEEMIKLLPLKSSLEDAQNLKKLIAEFADFNSPDEQIPMWKLYTIKKQARKFETTLNAELKISPAYTITPKGGYDVDRLLSVPHQAFPPDLVQLVPESEYDVGQAAKCLAFEVPTAAGFHLHRINEAVVHEYWDAVSDGKERPDRESIGVYLNAMKDDDIGDDKVVATLQQINSLHRNPVLHPQDNLSVQEAIELFGIIVSAVSSMLPAIKKHKAKYSAPEIVTALDQMLEKAKTG